MEPRVYSYESMGTSWRITLWDSLDDRTFTLLCQDILEASEHFDQTYSRFKKDSLVWALAQTTGIVKVPRDLVAMLSLYRRLYEPSQKYLNPLVGFTISDLGYDESYSLIKKASIRPVPDFNDTITILSEESIEIHEKVLFDFGALGKGYHIDSLKELLRNKGFSHFLIDGSGDIFYQGPEPITAGLEHPHDAKRAVGTIRIHDSALCASAGNRRSWGGMHHIINPFTHESPQEITAVWVQSESAALADGLATALFFSAPESFHDFSFEYCILNREYKIKRSAGFKAELFSE